MSKNASVILLNDLKKKKDEIEKKYQKLKNKKPTKLGISLYVLGIIATLIPSMIFLSEISMVLVGATIMTYSLGVPFIYCGIEASKEIKLENELKKYNAKIDRFELEINGIQVKHHYIDEKRGFVFEENEGLRNSDVKIKLCEEEHIQEESGPILRRKF